ncbi:S-adenosylmethionine:tRNA ribosyltransferase-isomerase [Mesobacillus zeae]|uniref:S-adenosylmethionine:tRNA ribosyltransferase-isomerase n=1 Tax=Mesobacillus zeae TaxID=1917180 RepID=A0A398B7S4_9BACI|nr:S-adenosylmethionine:tRNA ribosyltransferase-isomerase [Mesobacillus zeae]RID85857.1 S-adenosylmethionine:tRNA ribosyltransferase-isomerase [Mesobacillus zeae]
MTHAFNFHLPSSLNATQPPERRGVRRDHVRMMVLDKSSGHINHDRFINLEKHLQPGDLLVLNNSRTLPAVLTATRKRHNERTPTRIEIRLARRISENTWDVLPVGEEVRNEDILEFLPELSAKVITEVSGSPIKTICFTKKGADLLERIYSIGEPIRYEYIYQDWPLEYYQTVFASKPGSVEMPSAGRAFSWEVLFKLQKKGVRLAFIQLHTGLSYLLDDKWNTSPEENNEEFAIESTVMKNIYETKVSGGRVIAVGTTVVRALETAAKTGDLSGWTNLYIHNKYPLKIADGILTGFHEPKASHLDMLEAFVPRPLLFSAYEKAIKHGYLWHEFGDMNLIL